MPVPRFRLIQVAWTTLLSVCAFARAAAPIHIEAPFFEGGEGREFFIRCAREYEFQGTWDVRATSERQGVTGSFTDRFVVRDGLVRSDELQRRGFARITYEPVDDTKSPIRWHLAASSSHATLACTLTTDGISFDGLMRLSDSAGTHSYRLHGTKRNPVLVDMVLDPRIETKVQIRILSQSFFEVTNAPMNYWPLIHHGEVLNLTPYLNQPSWDGDRRWRDSFLPGSLNACRDKDKIYAVPFAYTAFVIWYNKKMFRRHGWTPPRTWDDLFALCKAIKKTGMAPIAMQGRYPSYVQPLFESAYCHMAGVDAWRASQRLVPGSYDNPIAIKCFGLLQRLATHYFQPGYLGMSHTEAQMEFFLGHTAMVPCGTWLKSEMHGKIPAGFELGCFNLPSVRHERADPTAVQTMVSSYYVMRHSRHPELGVDFLRFMTSRRMASMFVRMRDIPTCVIGSNKGNLSPDLKELQDIIHNAKTTYGAVPGEGYPEMGQYLRDAIYQAISGSATPATIARNLEQHARAIRSERAHPSRVVVSHLWSGLILLLVLGGGLIFIAWQAVRGFRRKAPRREFESVLPIRWHNVLLFVGPALLLYSVFVIVPSIRSFTWSVHRWSGLTPMSQMPYVGFLNFRRLLFESDLFWISLRNNLFLMFVLPVFVVPFSLFLSACISRRIWGGNFFRIVFFFPNLVGGVAATLLWLQIYNPQGGVINAALVGVGHAASAVGLSSAGAWLEGFRGYAWLEPKHLYWSLIPMSIWGACGFNMILYLAAMESIPETFYDAARIDGASPWRQFWTITLPLIWEILAISLVFLIIGGMKAFEVIWLLTNQQPQSQSHVVSTLMIQRMFQEFKVGQATALAVLLFLMIFVGTAATLRVMRREAAEF